MMKKMWIGIAAVLVLMFLLMQAFEGMQSKMEEKQNTPAATLAETTAEETAVTAERREDMTEESIQKTELPFSVLFYGKILSIRETDDGISQLQMDSPRDGRWVMNFGKDACYVDSGERRAFDPSELKEEDSVYVFCSPIAARSLPPQSPAYVVVRNIPMDAGCPMYHEVQKITEDGDSLILTVDGGKTLKLPAEDQLLSYEGQELAHTELREGQRIMGWYWDRGEEVIRASHVMILPDLQQE